MRQSKGRQRSQWLACDKSTGLQRSQQLAAQSPSKRTEGQPIEARVTQHHIPRAKHGVSVTYAPNCASSVEECVQPCVSTMHWYN